MDQPLGSICAASTVLSSLSLCQVVEFSLFAAREGKRDGQEGANWQEFSSKLTAETDILLTPEVCCALSELLERSSPSLLKFLAPIAAGSRGPGNLALGSSDTVTLEAYQNYGSHMSRYSDAVLLQCLTFLELPDIGRAGLVCKRWNERLSAHRKPFIRSLAPTGFSTSYRRHYWEFLLRVHRRSSKDSKYSDISGTKANDNPTSAADLLDESGMVDPIDETEESLVTPRPSSVISTCSPLTVDQSSLMSETSHLAQENCDDFSSAMQVSSMTLRGRVSSTESEYPTSTADSEASKPSPFMTSIINDVTRTLQTAPYFRAKRTQAILVNVLKAYSLYDTTVGYCQGKHIQHPISVIVCVFMKLFSWIVFQSPGTQSLHLSVL